MGVGCPSARFWSATGAHEPPPLTPDPRLLAGIIAQSALDGRAVAHQADEVLAVLLPQRVGPVLLRAEAGVVKGLDGDIERVELLLVVPGVTVDEVPKPAVMVPVGVASDHGVQPDRVLRRVAPLAPVEVIGGKLPVDEIRRALPRLLPRPLQPAIHHEVMPLRRDHQDSVPLPHVDEVDLEQRIPTQDRVIQPADGAAGVDARALCGRVALEHPDAVAPEEVNVVGQLDGVDADDIIPPLGFGWSWHGSPVRAVALAG